MPTITNLRQVSNEYRAAFTLAEIEALIRAANPELPAGSVMSLQAVREPGEDAVVFTAVQRTVTNVD